MSKPKKSKKNKAPNKLTPLQKAYIDEYYANGMDTIKAYAKVKNVDEPKEYLDRVNAANQVNQAIYKNPAYVKKKQETVDKRHGRMRDRLVQKLEEVASTYDSMVRLALQDALTEEDEAKFKRLKSIMTTADFNKAVDIMAKLTGSYEAEKVEISNTFKVSWGGAAKLQENNKDIIDVDHEDVDDD